MSNTKSNTIDLTQVHYDVYTQTAGIKKNKIIEVQDNGLTPTKFQKFKLKMKDQHGEVSYEEFDLSPYGLRKIKKFVEKTETLSEKEMKEFNHYKFIDKTYQVEYFATKNKHYDPTNPNSKEYILTIGNDTYSPIKKEKKSEASTED